MNSVASDPTRSDVLLWLRGALETLVRIEEAGVSIRPMRARLLELARMFDLHLPLPPRSVRIPPGLEAAIARSRRMCVARSHAVYALIPLYPGKEIQITRLWHPQFDSHTSTMSIVYGTMGGSEFQIAHDWAEAGPFRAYNLPHHYAIPPVWTLTAEEAGKEFAAPVIQAAARRFLARLARRNLVPPFAQRVAWEIGGKRNGARRRLTLRGSSPSP